MNPFKDYMHGYDLCSDTVTVYHCEGGAVTRTVYESAYLEMRRTGGVERTGGEGAGGFLLVVPRVAPACSVGDKVMLGEGPEVPAGDAAAWWRSFVPGKVDGLAVVRTVEVKRFGGRAVHTEAGG